MAALRLFRADLLAPAQVLACERRAAGANLLRRAEEDDVAAALAGARADVQDAVRFQHDLGIVLNHDQRVTRIAQLLHHGDDPLHVARMQADGGLVEHEQRVDQRGTQRSGQVDPLHFTTGQRARLSVECEIAQANIGQVAETTADLTQQQVGCFIQRLRQFEPREKLDVRALPAAASHRESSGRAAR